jgi:hypothetical protein
MSCTARVTTIGWTSKVTEIQTQTCRHWCGDSFLLPLLLCVGLGGQREHLCALSYLRSPPSGYGCCYVSPKAQGSGCLLQSRLGGFSTRVAWVFKRCCARGYARRVGCIISAIFRVHLSEFRRSSQRCSAIILSIFGATYLPLELRPNMTRATRRALKNDLTCDHCTLTSTIISPIFGWVCVGTCFP